MKMYQVRVMGLEIKLQEKNRNEMAVLPVLTRVKQNVDWLESENKLLFRTTEEVQDGTVQ